MQIRTKSALIMTLTVWAATSLAGQIKPAQIWNLPQGTAVKDNRPRTYRFVVDYNTAKTKGEMVIRQRLTGEYTRGLASGDVMWKNVTQAVAMGATAPFAAEQKRDFMLGFHYRNDLGSTLAPDFFKGFPPSAIMERNLVWDTGIRFRICGICCTHLDMPWCMPTWLRLQVFCWSADAKGTELTVARDRARAFKEKVGY